MPVTSKGNWKNTMAPGGFPGNELAPGFLVEKHDSQSKGARGVDGSLAT